jgi:hypothetical protein
MLLTSLVLGTSLATGFQHINTGQEMSQMRGLAPVSHYTWEKYTALVMSAI